MESKYTVVGDFRQPHKDCEGETLTDLSYEEAVRIENEWKKEKMHVRNDRKSYKSWRKSAY